MGDAVDIRSLVDRAVVGPDKAQGMVVAEYEEDIRLGITGRVGGRNKEAQSAGEDGMFE